MTQEAIHLSPYSVLKSIYKCHSYQHYRYTEGGRNDSQPDDEGRECTLVLGKAAARYEKWKIHFINSKVKK
jgi:hypothetical protein